MASLHCFYKTSQWHHYIVSSKLPGVCALKLELTRMVSLPTNIKPLLKWLGCDKHYSLLQYGIDYDGKKRLESLEIIYFSTNVTNSLKTNDVSEFFIKKLMTLLNSINKIFHSSIINFKPINKDWLDSSSISLYQRGYHEPSGVSTITL